MEPVELDIAGNPAIFAGAVKMLPRSGTWMNGVKKASGLVLLAFGAWLFYRAGGMK